MGQGCKEIDQQPGSVVQEMSTTGSLAGLTNKRTGELVFCARNRNSGIAQNEIVSRLKGVEIFDDWSHQALGVVVRARCGGSGEKAADGTNHPRPKDSA
jgi:hypothetical protein